MNGPTLLLPMAVITWHLPLLIFAALPRECHMRQESCDDVPPDKSGKLLQIAGSSLVQVQGHVYKRSSDDASDEVKAHTTIDSRDDMQSTIRTFPQAPPNLSDIVLNNLRNATIGSSLAEARRIQAAWSAKVASQCMAKLMELRRFMLTPSRPHDNIGLPLLICVILVLMCVLLVACREKNQEYRIMQNMAVQNHGALWNHARAGAQHDDVQNRLHMSQGDAHHAHNCGPLHHGLDQDPWHSVARRYSDAPGLFGGAVEPKLCRELFTQDEVILSIPKLVHSPRLGYSHQIVDQSGAAIACIAVERPRDHGKHTEEPGYVRERVILMTVKDHCGLAFAEVFLPRGLNVQGLQPHCIIFRPGGVRFGELQDTKLMVPNSPHRFMLSIYGSPASLTFEGDIRAGMLRVLDERHTEVAALAPQSSSYSILSRLDPVYTLRARPESDVGLIICCIMSMERMASSSAYRQR